MSDTEFNLLYLDENGNEIRGRRRKDVRRIVLEDGRSFSHTYMSANFDYVGRIGSRGKKVQEFTYETNVNGFKVRKPKAQS